uniref:MBD domain-containing protein n=1 Tax=Strigamia maritima TaxID=126957 RepID=T1IJG0_STRMM
MQPNESIILFLNWIRQLSRDLELAGKKIDDSDIAYRMLGTLLPQYDVIVSQIYKWADDDIPINTMKDKIILFNKQSQEKTINYFKEKGFILVLLVYWIGLRLVIILESAPNTPDRTNLRIRLTDSARQFSTDISRRFRQLTSQTPTLPRDNLESKNIQKLGKIRQFAGLPDTKAESGLPKSLWAVSPDSVSTYHNDAPLNILDGNDTIYTPTVESSDESDDEISQAQPLTPVRPAPKRPARNQVQIQDIPSFVSSRRKNVPVSMTLLKPTSSKRGFYRTAVPNKPGWEREEVQRQSGATKGQWDIYFYAPGRRFPLRSRPEIREYCEI